MTTRHRSETSPELGRQPSVTGLEALAAAEALDVHGPSPARAAVRRFVRDKRAVVSLAVVLFLVVGSFVFPLFYRHMGAPLPGGLTGTELIGPERYHDPSYVDLTNSDLPGTLLPLGARSSFHPLGTDVDGRDILARLLAGINISIEIALLVEVFDIGLGILLGTLAGWYGGWLGTLLDRSTDIVFAFPGLLLVLLMGAALGPLFDTLFHGAIFGRMLLLTLAIGLLAWPLMMRYVRGQTLLLKEQPYIEAARTAGTSNLKLILRHVVPNLVNIVVVASTLNILATIIGEAGISLLGAGLKPPASSLGLMISDATTQIYTSWTELFWPCAVLVALVLSLSFVGDGVRDAFDPRTKE